MIPNQRNFLVSYLQGMFAEFLAIQISKDENFYSAIRASSAQKINRYYHHDVLRELTSGYATANQLFHILSSIGYPEDNQPYYPKLKASNIEVFMDIVKSKNSISLTHFYWPHQTHLIDIPNVQLVNYYVEPEEVLFPFLMGVLKAWIVPFDTKNILSSVNISYQELDTLKKLGLNDTDEITLFDIYVLQSGHKDSSIERFVDEAYSYYYQRAIVGCSRSHKLDNWLYLNPYQLTSDPKNNVELWKDQLGMAKCLDVKALHLYHLKNEQLIRNYFRKPYQQLIEGDWKQTLYSILKLNSYFHKNN